MPLKPCIECNGMISTSASKCPTCGKSFPHGLSWIVKFGVGFLVLVGLPTLVLIASVIYKSKSSQTVETTALTGSMMNAAPDREDRTATPKALECRVQMTGSSQAVPVFPTKPGLDEYLSAAVSGDRPATEAAFAANGGFFVPAGTRCFGVDIGIVNTKVRILEGTKAGTTGWLPTEFAMH